MSTTDDAALDALDRRGRAAARTLLDDLAARDAGERPAPSDASDASRSTETAPTPVTDPPAPAGSTVIDLGRRTGRRGGSPARRRFLAAAAVAVLAAVAGTLAVVADDGGRDVTGGDGTDLDTTGTTNGEDEGPAVDPPAGSAVVMGDELATFGPDGQREANLPLAPLTAVQSVVSDRHGGWIACGSPPVEPATAAEAQLSSNVFRYRPGRDPEPLGLNVACFPSSLGVTEIDGHDALVYGAAIDLPADDPPHLRRYDLTTGERASLRIDAPDLPPGGAPVGGGRLLTLGADGLRAWDLASGEEVPVARVELPVWAPDAATGPMTFDITPSPSGDSAATLVGEIEDLEVVVYDLATGAERLRRPVTAHAEWAEVAYDGTTVAVGSSNDDFGPIQVFDVASGAERTVDAYGLLP